MTKRPAINCSIAKSLDLFGEKWSLLIIREAVMGSSRFDEFQMRLGVARNILAARLAKLVQHGIFDKTVSDESARIFHYRLSAMGRDLLPVLTAIMQWGDRWIHHEIGAPIVLLDRKTGAAIQTLGLASQAGTRVTLDDVIVTAGPGATKIMHERLARKTT